MKLFISRREIIMDNEVLLSKRMKELRKEREMTQREFAQRLSAFMGKDKMISASAVCSWEKGVKHPPYETLLAMSDYYRVSTDYLLGKTTDRSEGFILKDYTLKITEEQLKKEYDNKPVYLISKNADFPCGWGIYDKDNDCFFAAKKIMVNRPDMEYYAVEPEMLHKYSAEKRSLSLNEAKKLDQVWIEYENPDDSLRAKFTGWYRVNTDSSIFIASSGFALPFDSIDDVYHVYQNKQS